MPGDMRIVREWIQVERSLGDRLEELGFEVRWTRVENHFDFTTRDSVGRQRAVFTGRSRGGPVTRGWLHLVLDYTGIAYPILMTDAALPWLCRIAHHHAALDAAWQLGGQPALLAYYDHQQPWPDVPGASRG